MNKVIENQGSESAPLDAISPKKFAHAVLRSKGRYEEMVQWYLTVLNARIIAQAPI
jgi:hypothetical protein